MSMISEQIKELRENAEEYRKLPFGDYPHSTARILAEAADTIEVLSTKLAAANMNRHAQYFSGGWIPCKDRLPLKKGWYLVYAKDQRPFVAYFKGKTFPLNNHYHEIIAWMSLPEQYTEDENGIEG